MKRSLSLIILGLTAALALGALACGEDDKDPDVECTSNADCAGSADGKTECNLTTHRCVAPLTPTPAGECTSDADCAGNQVSGKIECDLTNKVCIEPTPPSGCTQDGDCDSELCVNGACATSKMAPCTDPKIAHATANTGATVLVLFENGGWTTPAACPWTCDSGYQISADRTACEQLPACTTDDDCRSKLCDAETKTCATAKQDKCKAYTDAELAARYATAQDSDATVTWTYVESSDGSAAWTAEGNCKLSACLDGYELKDDACISTTDSCARDSDCAGNVESGKTYCQILAGASEGNCIEPECETTADCKNNADGNVYCQNHQCVAYCTVSEDCQAVHGDEKPLCDWVYGSATYFTCIEAQCEPNTCSKDKRSFCKEMRWEACASDKECATEGGEGIAGTCQIIKSDQCDPECGDNQFCRDNGEKATERYVCEYLDAQLKSPTVRISQLYFGGYGNSTTAKYSNGFVQLYNYGDAEVDLSSLVLLQGTREGAFTMWLDLSLACADTNCKVAAGKYFLIKNVNNTNSSAEGFSGDVTASQNISQNGSLALATRLPDVATCNEVKKVSVDLIGMGSAYCSETTPAAGIPGTDAGEGNRGTHSYQRSNGNLDSGNNYNDFTPQPANIHK